MFLFRMAPFAHPGVQSGPVSSLKEMGLCFLGEGGVPTNYG